MPLPTATVDTREHLHLLGALLHHHHTGEDRLLWPVLQPVVPAELAPAVESMESQHEGIAELQAEAMRVLATWRLSASGEDGERLSTALEILLERLTEHLAAEEEHVLPLAARYMTPEQWNRLGGCGRGRREAAPAGARHGDVPRRSGGGPSHALPRPPGAPAADVAPRAARLRPVRPPGALDRDTVTARAWRRSGSVEVVDPGEPGTVRAAVRDVTGIGRRSTEGHAAEWLAGSPAGVEQSRVAVSSTVPDQPAVAGP